MSYKFLRGNFGTYRAIVVLFGLLTVFSAAFAQFNDAVSEPSVDTSIGVINQLTNDAVAAFGAFVKIANSAINSIRGNQGLQSYGEKLTLALTSIVVIWSIIKNIALKQSLSQLVGDLIFPLIIAAFVIGVGLAKLPQIIDQSISAIAGVFGSTGAASLEGTLAANMIQAAANIWNAPTADEGVLSFLQSPIMVVGMLILRIATILLVLVALGLAIAAILVAKFQMALAIALAPILIPWIVFKPTEFLFSGWLNFFLKAGFGLVGVFAVSSIVVQGSQKMASMITTADASMAGLMMFGAMASMSMIFTYLMLKASDIGEGIISGSATGIGQLSSVVKGAAARSPMGMAGGVAGAVGSAARMGAARAAGKAIGGGRLSEAQSNLASRAFGRGTVARATFETARGSKPASPEGKT